MEDLITIFRMTEISKENRIKIIIKLGEALNYKYGTNVTEPLVYELVKQINPDYQLPHRYEREAKCRG